VVLEYRDVDDLNGSDAVVGRAEGAVEVARVGEHLAYRTSPLLPDGSTAFTGHVAIELRPTEEGGTDLAVTFRVTDSAVDSADFVAGIELGFAQSLDRLAALLDAHPTDPTSSAKTDNSNSPTTRSTT